MVWPAVLLMARKGGCTGRRVLEFTLGATVFTLLATVATIAQDKPIAEVTGSYQFDHLTLSGGGASVSTNVSRGWDGSINVPILRGLGVVGDFGRVWKSESSLFNVAGSSISASANASLYTYGGGPQLTYRGVHYIHPFARFILGDAHSTGVASVNSTFGNFSSSGSVDSFFIAPGGGADFLITHNVWLRGAADYLRTSKNGATVNGIRAFAGVTFTFGGAVDSDQAESRSAHSQPMTPAISAGVKVDALGVTVALGRGAGAEIIGIQAGGMAALAGLRLGDVISRVDDRPVKTPQELATELSNRAAGDKVRVGYLIRGQWQSELFVTLGQSH